MKKQAVQADVFNPIYPSFNAIPCNDEEIDEASDGFGIYLAGPGISEGRKQGYNTFPAHLHLTPLVHPISLVRRKGKWGLQFEIVNSSCNSAPSFFIECGTSEGQISFEDAAACLCEESSGKAVEMEEE